jgi:hypothetical protein
VAEAESGRARAGPAAASGADVVLLDVFSPASTASRRRRRIAGRRRTGGCADLEPSAADVGADRVVVGRARGFVDKSELSRAALDLLVA